MVALTWVFGTITVVSLLLTVYYGRRTAALERARRKLEWADLQVAAAELADRLRDEFQPDFIFAPSLRGATFANLLIDQLNRDVPVLVGVTSWKAGSRPLAICGGYVALETSKWFIHVPQCLFEYRDSNILVVDDFVMSGDFLQRLRDAFVHDGLTLDRVKTLAIVTTRVAIRAHKAPDYHWMDTADDSFYFPWGKAR